VVIRDVTSEHQLEQVRKDFVANASHELRTPLAIINGYLENLLDEGMLDDRDMTRRFLTVMRKHSDRISRIVEDTLAHPSFSADHDTALLDALETSYQRLEPLSRAACEAADLVLPRLPNRSQASMAAEIDARIATLDAQEKRRAVVKDALQRVRAMLGDADPALSARVDDAIFSADSLARADAFERRALSARREALADGPATPVAAPGGAAPGKETTPAPAPSGTTTNAPGGRTAPSTPADGTVAKAAPPLDTRETRRFCGTE
jgi:signal transduction histidine kinase